MAEPTFNELMKKADAGELSSRELEYIMQEHARMVREEFEAATAENPENAEKAKVDFCRNHMGTSLAQIQWLSLNADSESVRLAASKFLVQGAIDESEREGDPIKELMQKLQAAPAS